MQPTSIGPFQIQRELGRGGMGVVYLAFDTKLDRRVAIKALPADLALDPDRLARFEREAKLLAALSHPNIGAIYGLESAGGHQYLVLEYIDGETLAERLANEKLPLPDALAIARQIAEALDVAHEKGIIHRDLKPGNVMVTPDGAVKVLDFGLARTADGSPSSIDARERADSPTVSSPLRHSPSMPGAILGTAGYMSPEQARGRPVDKRTDIFSFGCVLYEMLTGAGPFPGETVTDSLGAILHRDPDWSVLPTNIPPRIRDLLAHCLAKDRKTRLRDIGDARIELERAIAGHDAPMSDASPSRRGVAGSVLALAAVVAAGAGCWLLASRLASPAAARTVMLDIPTRTATYQHAGGPIVSPDGQSVIFEAQPSSGGSRCLWLRRLDSFEAKPIPYTSQTANGEAVRECFWSPDSRSIGFVEEDNLYVLDLAGGSRRLVAADLAVTDAVWAEDGTIIVVGAAGTNVTSQIGRVPATGGRFESLIRGQQSQWLNGLTLLPDGKGFLYLSSTYAADQQVRTGQLYAARLGATEGTPIGDFASAARYIPPGWLVYVVEGTLKAVPFDLATLKVTGESISIADDVQFFKPTGSAALSAGRDGTLAYSCPAWPGRAVWFGTDGTQGEPLPTEGGISAVRISPDGTSVVATVEDQRTGLADLWRYHIARGSAARLTSDPRWEGRAVWSHDGATLYFSADWNDYPEIYALRADGTGQPRRFYDGEGTGRIWWACDVSPDGKSLLVQGVVDKQSADLRIVSLDAAAGSASRTVTFQGSASSEMRGSFSPDGTWVAYQGRESGRLEIYIAPLPGREAGRSKVQVSTGGGEYPRWSPKGDKLYYIEGGPDQGQRSTSKIMVVDLAGPEDFASPPTPRVALKVAEHIEDFDVAPDGKRLLVVLSSAESPPMRIILNGLPKAR